MLGSLGIMGSKEKPKIKITFNIGDMVQVTSGPFSDFTGVVSDLDADKGKVKVLVSIFGRETPVELDFSQVVKT
jgi:transcription termination/antitermination protein NusG